MSYPLVTAANWSAGDSVSPAFQAGHAGSIPVARSHRFLAFQRHFLIILAVPLGCVLGAADPSPAEMGEDNHADVWAPSATRPSSTACASTTAPGCASTAHTRKRPGRRPEDPMPDAAARLDRRRPQHPRRPRDDMATMDGRRTAQPPDPLRASPGRTGAGRARLGAPVLLRARQGRLRAEPAIGSVAVVIPGLEDLHLFVVGAVHEPVFVVDAAGPIA